ncbi:MAG: GrpB family protein [Alphaproteobacteria bacterium]|nr:GrpB family protein [Alphaproteobacteria bacterium]
MYLAILRYKVPEGEIERYRSDHIDFLKKGYERGDFIVSGKMFNGKGGVILSPLTRRGNFEQLLKEDPFKIHDLATYEIIGFDPSRFHPDFTPFIREREKETIELHPYKPEWEKSFQDEAKALKEIFGKNLLEIHHIGSTAIPGTVAKPIIDILPVVEKIEDVDKLTPAFEKLGYTVRGEFGMPGRRFFIKTKDGKRYFNVHVFQEGHPDIERHLRFRNHMRTHSEDAKAYSDLKKKLIADAPDDMEKYSWGKEDFVKAIELRAFLWRTPE